MPINLVQKQDLAPASFANANTLAAGGITVRVDAGSTVGAAIAAAVAGATIPDATDTVKGKAALAVGANFPQHTNDVDAATPAYVKAVLDAFAGTIPGDKFLQGLQSYNPTTNVMTLAMSDGSTVNVDMTALLADATATITTGKVSVLGNDGTTVLGYLLPV
jgi:hypothetical protein